MADPRLDAARPGVVGVTRVVTMPIAALRRAPSHDAALETQAVMGERVAAFETTDGFAWCQLARDGYVGWMPADALGEARDAPTHRVSLVRTFAFPSASIKVPPAATLPMNARLHIARIEGAFAVTGDGLHVPAQHVVGIGEVESDVVTVAERFVGTPYLWGGVTSLGIDCSGLVQTAFVACGLNAPRDSDMQEAALGRDIALDDIERGDLLFWTGHVAIACEASRIVHANAFHMATAIEPLDTALARIGMPTRVKRVG